MENPNEILEQIQALSAAAENARMDYCAKAIALADEVVRNRENIGDIRCVISGLISKYMEADERYTKAVDEVNAACERLKQCINGKRKGGAK